MILITILITITILTIFDHFIFTSSIKLMACQLWSGYVFSIYLNAKIQICIKRSDYRDISFKKGLVLLLNMHMLN
jgi:hypothetical protein